MFQKNKYTIIVTSLSLLILILFIVFFVKYQHEKAAIEEFINYEKEQLEEEYSDWSFSPENSTIKIGNDSLIVLLNKEKSKIHQLLEEIRTLESTNVRKMNELRKELADVRKVASQYICQIDSLNNVNQKLRDENKEIKRRNREIEESLQRMKDERRTLTTKVTQASMLETSNIHVDGLNIVGRKTTILQRMENFQCNFRINKNKTASVGKKDVYIRFTSPDGELFRSPSNSGITTFTYENKKIPFTSRKEIEYEGEDLDLIMFWKANQPMVEGTYRVEIFVDGFLIGEKEVLL